MPCSVELEARMYLVDVRVGAFWEQPCERQAAM